GAGEHDAVRADQAAGADLEPALARVDEAAGGNLHAIAQPHGPGARFHFAEGADPHAAANPQVVTELHLRTRRDLRTITQQAHDAHDDSGHQHPPREHGVLYCVTAARLPAIRVR